MTRPKRKPAAKSAAKPRAPTAPQLRKLAEPLALDGAEAQIAALEPQLAKLAPPRAAVVATALLAHTTSGAPVVRAYLTTLAATGDGAVPAADSVAKFCATAGRGRRVLRAVFAATWRRASDMHAVDAAYKNLATEVLDDPELLAAGVEAARRLGRDAAATERAARLERATRLTKLVDKLAAKRGMAELEKLPLEDVRHVYRRIISAPARFDEKLAVPAIVALAEDPAVSDVSLSTAIAELAAKDELVAVWRERIAAGDDALVMRLLALFEWAGLSATDPAQLAPYIRALQPAGGRPEVFAQIDSALASESMVVRAAVLDGWLRDAAASASFDDAQIGMLMRSAIAIAEAGADTIDRRAAHAVLACCAGHPATAPIVIDAIRAPRAKRAQELRASLYAGLAHVRHPAIPPFLIEQLFVEREVYPPLLDALATHLDLALHKRLLAIFTTRARDADVLRAVTLYAELIVDKTSSPRLLVDVGRMVSGWQPTTTDDQRRLRYILERAVVAALGIYDVDNATALLARARELPPRPYSEYRVVGRAEDTPAPFADSAVQTKLADLDEGIFPLAPAEPGVPDDSTLSELVGSAVATRIFDDQRGTVWFLDELGELHVFDKGTIASPPPFQLQQPLTDIAALLGGKSFVDERVTLVDATHKRVREVIRIGDRMLVFHGPLAAPLLSFGCKLGSYVATRDVVRHIATHPPRSMKKTDPWKQVTRSYESVRGVPATVAIRGSNIEATIDDSFPTLQREHANAQAAVAAYHLWEVRLFAAGGRLVAIVVE
jgi:hypothetical protein